jgi:hypothetical protein
MVEAELYIFTYFQHNNASVHMTQKCSEHIQWMNNQKRIVIILFSRFEWEWSILVGKINIKCSWKLNVYNKDLESKNLGFIKDIIQA